MPKFMNDKEARKYLAAFADGELDVEQSLAVLEYMAMQPQATRRVMHQQQLRESVRRCCAAHTPAMQPSLRQAVEQKLARAAAAQRRQVVLGRVRRWVPLTLAAMLAIVALAALWNSYQHLGPGTPIPGGAAGLVSNTELLPASQLERFAAKHEDCARAIDVLHNRARYPRQIAQVPDAIRDFLGQQTYATLDLSSLGYQFAGMGECGTPGARALHLVYQPRPGSDLRDNVSLWIAPDDGRFANVTPNTPYVATSCGSAHPLILWRHNGLIYYLVGDRADHAQQAVGILASR
ncbi:MAG: hypothetical protein WD042_04090 [Phycisphaeraceae bacterium]